ncbi:hypothetical protein [Lactococcus lactis]|uniref:Prophage protein n=1 Tax=Lactococcus lactis TaxID=1358 RepID=A0A6M0MBV3_9LACT|nr:hypothetical protein [Lactococcus lactis]MCT1174513.1 hypothetical protein [Lactococcus lactis]NEX51456.1 hypothetical protein [Lactococcus lactis]NEX56792.1 hypothetical protein [Lactococcus lactis]
MSVKVTFSNGENIVIHEDTQVVAWKSLDKEDGGYYAETVHIGSNVDSENLQTSEQVVGLLGLFGNSDWFSIERPVSKFYKTSAIVHLENI